MLSVEKIISNLPKSPGVYQFLNKEGKIIYIGKAKDLRNRVSSYFNKNKYDSFKTKTLAQQVFEIKHIVVTTESDALLLENNLIKKHLPKYNILLKDDKTFPWICIKNETFPRIYSTRKLSKDGSLFFGPYTSALMVKTLLTLIRQIYQLRTCNYNLIPKNIAEKKFKKCLEYHIGNCKAPCENLQTEYDYQNSILQIKEILKGNIHEIIRHLETLMKRLANEYKYEEAELVKQKIYLLEKFQSKSTIVNPKLNNIDVFSIVEIEKSAFVNFLKIMNGSIVQSYNVELVKRLDETPEELLLFAIIDIRTKVNSEAKEIIIPFLPSEQLPEIKYTVPRVGDKKKLLELSQRNAKQLILQNLKIKEEKPFDARVTALLEKVKSDLHLTEIPVIIECFDNSNIQGSNPVAACVVFKNGKPAKNEYRHFNVKSVVGPDDFASMEEIVYRRYKRQLDEQKDLPQLIIIDGGKGQLNAAVRSLMKLDLYGKVAIIGIAKRLEEIFFPGDSIPLYLNKKSSTLMLIQNLRNEAHRFGINFHRDKRSSEMIKNKLEGIKGVGKITAEKLLKYFGSVENLKHIQLSEMENVISKKIAIKVIEFLKND
jgi:excinuclease ABC subunit C